jgi:hypothetical protein
VTKKTGKTGKYLYGMQTKISLIPPTVQLCRQLTNFLNINCRYLVILSHKMKVPAGDGDK